ncbi:MAG TPA: retropepsin-like aspartic protease [Candidatus Baltobacteraceae bacterium]|nr:retropepsin-like aspartic protease [Candidatus Baltobacteraceae bacterium]
MKLFANGTVAGASAFIFCALVAVRAIAQVPAVSAGDAAFAAGNFDAAASAYAAALAANPSDADAVLGAGTVELYRNHLRAARAYLRRALLLDPHPTVARARLNAIERRTAGPHDYRIAFAASFARIPLTTVDPLPTFKAKIDGVPVTLMLDTGGSNIDLSEATIERLHLKTTSAGEGVFAGGLKAKIRSLRIDRFEAPGVSVRGIPGGVVPGAALPGIDGIVGTDFLSHFLSTIDYAHRALVLRPVTDSTAFRRSAAASGATEVPMWLVGDHFIFARARVNEAPEALYNIDTGGSGIGVDLTKSELTAAGITPDAAHPQYMMGGGGKTQLLPFTAAVVAMGGMLRHNLPGVYVPSGGLDGLFPFAVAGRISHEFFRHAAVTFDFASMTLVLAPS